MEVELTLSYRDFTIILTDTFESLYAAEYIWTLGGRACDCERCEYLMESGFEFEEVLPCNQGYDDQQIKLVSLKPFIVH